MPLMGLGVIDEQHRFGVIQRLSLQHITGRADTAISVSATAAYAADERDADPAQSGDGALRRHGSLVRR